MPRTITEDALEELYAGAFRPCFLVSIQFSNETVYAWTGVGDLVWGGSTYKGLGPLASISPITESIDTQAQGITLTLSGIPTELLNDALNTTTTQGAAKVYLAFLTATGTLVADPILSYSGFTDAPQLDMSTETNSISIAVENRLADLQRARGGRWTDADQRARHPNDGGLKYVAWLQDQQVRWSAA